MHKFHWKMILSRVYNVSIYNRYRHCMFVKLDTLGKCRARCAHNRLKRSGVMFDCIGIESETAGENLDRIYRENKFN